MNLHFSRTIRHIIAGILLFTNLVPASGQESGVGYVRFVNAIGLKGNMTLLMNGEAVNAKGYESGAYTGGVGLKVGSYNFTFEHPLLDKLERNIDVVDGETLTYIAYVKSKLDDDGKVIEQELDIYVLEPSEEGGASVTAVSLCEHREELPIQFLVEGADDPTAVFMVPMKPRKVSLNRGGDIALAYEKKVIASMTMAEPGNFAVAIYEATDKEGVQTLKASLFLNEKFSGRN